MLPIRFRVYNKLFEIPIKNWDEVSKTNSLQPLIKRGVAPKNILDVWYDLQDQYTKRYGTTREYKEYIDLVKKTTILKCNFIEKGQRYLLNEINKLDVDIEAKRTQTHPLELNKALPKMSKYYGYPIRDNISAGEFFDHLNNMNNG